MALQIVKDTFHNFLADECPKTSSSLAYYTLFSLPPLLVIVTAIVGLVVDPGTVENTLRDEFAGLLGPNGGQTLIDMLHNASKPGTGIIAFLVGAIALLIGATGVVVQLQDAMNDTWDVEPDPKAGGLWNFIRKRILSLGMILAIAFVLLVSLLATTVIGAFGTFIGGFLPSGWSKVVFEGVNMVVSLGIVTLLFAAMFKYLPDADLHWKNVWLGAFVTAALFTLGKFAIGLYLGRANVTTAYGSAGSLVLVLVWIYYSAMIFFFGAEFTRTWTKAHGEEIPPARGAVKVVEKKEVQRPEGEEVESKKAGNY